MPRQFSLKTLLLLMVVVGAFFGGWTFAEKQEQMRLAAEREWLNARDLPASQARPIKPH